MIQSTNFPLSSYCIKPFGSWDRLAEEIKALGLDGIEAIADPDDLDDTLSRSLVSGEAWFEGSGLTLSEERLINDPEDVIRISTALTDFAQLNHFFKGGNSVASDSE